MATNQVSEGEVIQVTSAANYTSGLPVEIGELFGVPVATTTSGAQAALTVRGEFAIVKQGGAGVAFAQGDPVYWDGGNGRAVATPNGAFSRIGVATDTAANAATTVNVLIDGFARPEEYITSSATLQGLGAAGSATTTRANVPIWKNKTGRSVKLVAAQFRQNGPIELVSDTNDTYAISLGKTGAVSVVASVTYDDAPLLPAMTVATAMTIITAASANVFAADDELYATWSCALNDAAKQMPDVELQLTFQVL
jgi:predicted RecA/RadA family phage recombinase